MTISDKVIKLGQNDLNDRGIQLDLSTIRAIIEADEYMVEQLQLYESEVTTLPDDGTGTLDTWEREILLDLTTAYLTKGKVTSWPCNGDSEETTKKFVEAMAEAGYQF